MLKPDMNSGLIRQSKAVRQAHHNWWINKQSELSETFTKSNVDSVSVRTDQDYVKALLNLFAKRN